MKKKPILGKSLTAIAILTVLCTIIFVSCFKEKNIYNTTEKQIFKEKLFGREYIVVNSSKFYEQKSIRFFTNNMNNRSFSNEGIFLVIF